jgi:antirestriction protein ArdC
MSDATKPDLYRRITDQIVAAIEAGAADWRMPWHTDPATPATSIVRPVNALTGKPYRGANVVALWATAETFGYKSAQWATYNQWQELGAQVRKGERASLVVFGV